MKRLRGIFSILLLFLATGIVFGQGDDQRLRTSSSGMNHREKKIVNKGLDQTYANELMALANTTNIATNVIDISTNTADIASYSGEVEAVPQYTGDIYYVATGGSDSNPGTSSDSAFATIGKAIGELSTGDKVIIGAKTYTETGLDLDVNSTELWFEIGAILDPASDTALIVSGNFCKVIGQCMITPNADVGVAVTGTNGYFENIFVSGGTSGWQITGIRNEFRYCRSINATVAGFDIQAGRTRLVDCNTGGTGTATFGYYINNGADKGLLHNCTSVSHDSAGFYIATGSSDWTLLDCSSGSGDGRSVDTDHGAVWVNFHFDDLVAKSIAINANATTSNNNLFEFTGGIEILHIYGIVKTTLGSDVNNCYFNAYDGTNTIPITLATDPDMDNAPAGSLFHKIADADVAAVYTQSDQVRLSEDDTKFGVNRTFLLNAKAGVTNYIRFTYDTSADLSTHDGVMHFHIHWRPMSDDGFVK